MKHLKYLNKFFWKYKKLLVIGTLFVTLSNLFALYPAEFVRKAFDTVINYNDTTINISLILLKYSSLIVVFAILKGVFMYFMRQTIIVMSRKIEYDLKNEIYMQYQKLSMDFYKKNKTGDLMNRISEDISRVRMYVGPALMYTINITILFSLVLSKMFYINSKLTIYVLIPLPVLAVTVYFVSRKINYRSEKVQEKLSQLTTISQESFSGIKILKSSTNENNLWKKFNRYCRDYTNKQLNLIKIEAFFFPSIVTLIGFSTALTIYIGGLESIKGNISTGNIAEFIIYINMLAWPVASIGWITSLVQRAAASQERINNFLLLEPTIQNNISEQTPIKGEICFNKVSLTYNNTNITALKNISFNIKQGETLGIFGKTGSGKSTIAHLICRLYDVTKGSVKINNIEIKKHNLYNLRFNMGYVPQDGYLFSGTIRDNIAFSSNNKNEKDIINAARKAEILDEINKFPEGFDTIIGERGIQLSGGQRQRIAIARTFYKKPNIFIFDDCLSAIDTNKEQKILKNMHVESQNKSTIIISHRIKSIQKADNIIVLKKGEIIEQGNHNDLLNLKGLYYNIFISQNNI